MSPPEGQGAETNDGRSIALPDAQALEPSARGGSIELVPILSVTNPCIVVPAAGSGTRFLGPGHKLEGRIGDASVLGLTLRHALATGARVVLVVSRRVHDGLLGTLPDCEQVVVDTHARPGWGMGDSIAAGVAAAADADGWLVLPGDMPFVRPDSMARVAAALARHDVAYASHDGRRGHPVAFRATMKAQLLALTGDTGARAVMQGADSVAVEVDDAGILVDIDTVADLDVARRLPAMD
jgi:molybdenum cofactor cytidylyltransferase